MDPNMLVQEEAFLCLLIRESIHKFPRALKFPFGKKIAAYKSCQKKENA
jgi:hypothetical protein